MTMLELFFEACGGQRDIDVVIACLDPGPDATAPIADVHLADADGHTPLHVAAAWGNEAIVRLLLARGANPLAATDAGLLASDLAAEGGHEAVAALLHEASRPPPPPPPGDMSRVDSLAELQHVSARSAALLAAIPRGRRVAVSFTRYRAAWAQVASATAQESAEPPAACAPTAEGQVTFTGRFAAPAPQHADPTHFRRARLGRLRRIYSQSRMAPGATPRVRSAQQQRRRALDSSAGSTVGVGGISSPLSASSVASDELDDAAARLVAWAQRAVT